jgi:hypothetical protein
MSKYRKKPVVIEARQLAEHNALGIADWSGGNVYTTMPDRKAAVLIPTLEGNMRADVGDFVICGVAGEFYPCKPDIFQATYEAVEDDA